MVPGSIPAPYIIYLSIFLLFMFISVFCLCSFSVVSVCLFVSSVFCVLKILIVAIKNLVFKVFLRCSEEDVWVPYNV